MLVNTDDGAATGSGGGPDSDHVDNAYMDTPPDGTSPTMAMFLFFNNNQQTSATSTAATTPRSSTTSTRTASAAGS